jgi:hypothetical protein
MVVRRELCHAVEALVADVAGAADMMQCEHGEGPRCHVAIASDE